MFINNCILQILIYDININLKYKFFAPRLFSQQL